jgi:hypothetical protein
MTEGFGGFMFGPPPPEIIAQLQARQEHQHMHAQDNTHAIKQLFDSLDEEQLRALDLLLANCMDSHTVLFFRGRIEMLQQIKFDICPCGDNHNDDLDALTQDKGPTVPNASHEHKGRPVEDVDLPVDPLKDFTVDPGLTDPEELVKARARFNDEAALMAEYRIEKNPDFGKNPMEHGPAAASPFRCIDCKIGVASLEDRMLRKPGIEGCSGCQQKSAWG